MMLLHCVCRNRNVVNRITTDSRTTIAQLHFLQNPSLILTRFISITPNPNQFTLDYLINSCGLSPQSALKASQHIVLESTTKPDSVLSLFKTYGLTQSHISTLINKRPSLLLAKPDKILKPKLDFFTNIGISGPALGKFLSSEISILSRNLEKQIIPSINFLRSVVHTDTSIASILSRSRWVLHDAESIMGPNIAILREHGVPESNISKLVKANPQKLYCKSERFNHKVLQLKEMGIRPSAMTFILCLHVLLSMKESTWDAKLAVYKSFGWSGDEVLSVFKKQPFVMAISEKKIISALDFFTNNLKWTQGDVAKTPMVMLLSLEKRIIPRCYVLQTLLSKDLIIKSIMGHALASSEDVFLKKFVIKYHHEVPRLFELYQSKLCTQGSKVGLET